jgi:hypothetical protein
MSKRKDEKTKDLKFRTDFPKRVPPHSRENEGLDGLEAVVGDEEGTVRSRDSSIFEVR